MSYMNIERVTVLPETLRPSTLYVVRSPYAGLADLYFTSSDGTDVRHILSKNDVQSMINQYVVNATSGLTGVKIVATIIERNGLDLTTNGLCLVLDATADASVSVGAALYVYDAVALTWTKVAEYKSMDVSLLWSSIQGRPVSTPAQIDSAVVQAHTHLNHAVLDKITEDGNGNVLFGGEPLKIPLSVAEW